MSKHNIFRFRRAVTVLPVLFAVALGLFVLSACDSGGRTVATANFSSAEGWELVGDGIPNDWILTDRFSFSDNRISTRPVDLFAGTTAAALPAVALGQTLNLSRNSYYRIRIDGAFIPDVIGTTQGSLPSVRLRAGGAAEDVAMVETSALNMNNNPETWTVVRLYFYSGNRSSVDFEIVFGRGTRPGELIIRNFIAERVRRNDILGNDARSLNRKQIDGQNNLITTDWTYGLPTAANSYVTLPDDWNAHGVSARVVRNLGAAQPWFLELSLTAHGSGFVNSQIAVRRGHYYRLTFDVRILQELLPKSDDPEGPFGGDRFGIFASLNSHQSDILRFSRNERDNRFNFHQVNMQWRTSTPIFIRARSDVLDLALNLGFPDGGEVRGIVQVFNIRLEEVGVTAIPVHQPFVQDAGANIGVIVAWITFAIILTTAIIIGFIIGIKIYTSRRRNAKETQTL